MNAVIKPIDLHPELADFSEQISRIREDARNLTGNLNDAQINWRTQPGSWSIAQCLAHVTLGHQGYLAAIDIAITQARARQLFGSGPFKYGWMGNWFARSFEPPPKFKLKNPKVITPPPDLPAARVVSDFDSAHEDILRRLHEANGIDLGRAKMTSPFLRLLRLSLGQAFAVLTAHARRHLWQAWQVRKHPAFPQF